MVNNAKLTHEIAFTRFSMVIIIFSDNRESSLRRRMGSINNINPAWLPIHITVATICSQNEFNKIQSGVFIGEVYSCVGAIVAVGVGVVSPVSLEVLSWVAAGAGGGGSHLL